jgi:hypothetical protein
VCTGLLEAALTNIGVASGKDNQNAKESEEKNKEDQKAENYQRSFSQNSGWFCSTTGSSRKGTDAFCA